MRDILTVIPSDCEGGTDCCPDFVVYAPCPLAAAMREADAERSAAHDAWLAADARDRSTTMNPNLYTADERTRRSVERSRAVVRLWRAEQASRAAWVAAGCP